jgi:endonuclease YncB( thermonuclease family)
VYDGDTFYINLSGLPRFFGHKLAIRLKDVDTPELRSRCLYPETKKEEKRLANLAKTNLKNQLANATIIQIRNIERGSFFRLSAHVYVDGVLVNDGLIKEGVGMLALDGHQFKWCEHLSNLMNQ